MPGAATHPASSCGRRENIAAAAPRRIGLARRLLDLLDHAEKVLKLGIRLAEDPHAAQVADVALVISAGVEGQDVAGLQALVRGRAVEARAGRDQAVFEGQAAVRPPRVASVSTSSCLVCAGRTPVEHSEHRGDDTLGGFPQRREFVCRLSRAQPLQREQGVDDLDSCLARPAATWRRPRAGRTPRRRPCRSARAELLICSTARCIALGAAA